jgi:hypothetical protein
MANANSLRDLLRIRFENRDLIEQVNGNLGSAVGFKYKDGALTDAPAVIIYVKQKIHQRWLPTDQVIPETLQGLDGLVCRTDVVQAESSWQDSLDLAILLSTSPVTIASVPWSALRDAPPLTSENIEALEALHGAADRMYAGSRLSGYDARSNGYHGTAGCFVKDRETGKLGILTNHHVADHPGNVLRFPNHDGVEVGEVTRLYEYIPDERRFPNTNQQDAYYRVDCAYLELRPDMADKIDPHLFGIGKIGTPLPLDLDTMGPIGQRVVSVGSRRGIQKGRIAAFSFEYYDGYGSYYTDYLLLGDEGMSEGGIPVLPTALSDHGDSGKLFVTDDHEHSAVALLWGGALQQRRPGKLFEKWSWAIDINRVLDLLQVDIYS